jgi:hypothetical protein
MSFKIRNAVIALAAYVAAFVWTASVNPYFAVGLAVYVILCFLLVAILIKFSALKHSLNKIEFFRYNPASPFGGQWASFHHLFYRKDNAFDEIHKNISTAISTRLNFTQLEPVEFIDKDKDVIEPEIRTLFKAVSAPTKQQTVFTFLYLATQNCDVIGVRWWVFCDGPFDYNKLFWRYASSPIYLPFNIISCLTGHANLLEGLTSIQPGFFNSLDVSSGTREIQFVAFETLVETLEKFGIDTSDLKMQKGNILNINVTGGSTSFGAVVQGALNKITTSQGV